MNITIRIEDEPLVNLYPGDMFVFMDSLYLVLEPIDPQDPVSNWRVWDFEARKDESFFQDPEKSYRRVASIDLTVTHNSVPFTPINIRPSEAKR